MRHEAQRCNAQNSATSYPYNWQGEPNMQWKMSKKLYGAWVKRRVRVTPQTPRRLAYLWMDMIKPKLFEVESVFETPIFPIISKRRYGMKAEGNPVFHLDRMKSILFSCESLWLIGYKPCSSAEGATCGKITGQIHKTCYPELECSGAPRGAMCNTVNTDAALPQRRRGELGMRGTEQKPV